MDEKLKNFLQENNIDYYIYEHEPVYTCEEAKIHCSHIEGLHCKNLFLKEKKKDNYFLLSMPADKKLDIRILKNIIGINALTFAKPEELKEILNLEPGSVSPFGLIYDKENRVKFLIDDELIKSEFVTFHPNINSKTIKVKNEDFELFIEKIGNEYKIIEL